MDLLGRLVSPRRGLEYLRRLGLTRQVPRPRHAQGDFAALERFKADFRARMEELAREDPTRSSARSGRVGVSARWHVGTNGSSGSMSSALSGRQPAMWSGSW